jgi:hypothetical protein
MDREWGMHIPALEPGITHLLSCVVDIPRACKLGDIAVNFLQVTQVIL